MGRQGGLFVCGLRQPGAMVLAELWEFSQAEEGKGCGEKQREIFLNLEWNGMSLQ